MRHYSKVLIELPDSADDPPYAVVTIDCDVCGEEEIRIHMMHLGTVLRTLSQTMASFNDDGVAQSMSGVTPSTPENKQKVRDYLDRAFPDWKAERLRQRQKP